MVYSFQARPSVTFCFVLFFVGVSNKHLLISTCLSVGRFGSGRIGVGSGRVGSGRGRSTHVLSFGTRNTKNYPKLLHVTSIIAISGTLNETKQKKKERKERQKRK